ncbi:MAG: hypothetical protein JW717_01465 [Marinilabiliaceae bacterium]|nr:hypothetical protein [Marinilabiliaceae bacterium]
MKYKSLKYFAIAFLSITIGFSGCKKDTIDLDQMPDGDRKYTIVGPVAKIHFTMGELVEKVNFAKVLSIEDDGLIVRNYEDDVELKWDDLAIINNVDYSFSLPVVGNSSPSQGSYLIEKSITEKFKLNLRDDARYDSAIIESGTLTMNNLNFPPGSSGSIQLSIPELNGANGAPWSKTIDISNFNAISDDLTQNKIVFKQAPDSSYVTLEMLFNVTVPLESGSIDFNFNVSNIIPAITYGYFGQQVVEERNRNIEFDVYEEFEFLPDVELANIELIMDAENNIGTPYSVTLENVVFSDNGDNPNQLQFYNTNIFNINSATLQNSIITPSNQTYKIDGYNTNIMAISKNVPNQVMFDVIGKSNPQNDNTAFNFINHHNTLNAHMLLKFPFWFKSSDYERIDTIEFNFNEEIEQKYIDAMDSVFIKFKFYNGLPIKLTLSKAIMTDDNYTPIRNLISENGEVINPGVFSNDKHVTEATLSNVIISFDKNEFQDLANNNAKYIIITLNGIANDDNNISDPFIKIFEDNWMDINVSTRIKSQLPNSLFE